MLPLRKHFEGITMKSSTKKLRGKIVSLSLGHMINDIYMNQIQIMLPYLVLAGISLDRGAFLVSLFTISSSLLQPIFGYLSDKKHSRWIVFSGTLWMSVLLGLFGLISNYTWMMIVATLAGLGTAAFHPQASAMVAACSQNRKTFVQAIFIASGNVGWALTPLLAVPLLDKFGLGITPVFMVPGVIMSFILWLSSRNLVYQSARSASSEHSRLIRRDWFELTKIMLIVALRSLTYFSLIAFLPLYLQLRNISLVSGSRLIFLMLLAGSIGGLIGGFLADKYGRKTVAMVSLLLTSPFLFLFLKTTGPISISFLVLAGAFLLGTFSVTVTLAHRVIGNRTGLASGLMLGFGTGIGGLGVGLMGLLAHHYGIPTVIQILIWLPLLAGCTAMWLRSEK